MSSPHKQPPARVPTLTEVVALEAAVPPAPAAVELPAAASDDPHGAELVAQRVVEALRPWVDSMFEQRLREALMPEVDALLQTLLKQLRGEFDPLLREAVSRALAQGAPKPP